MGRHTNDAHPAEQYCRSVVDGQVVAGQLVRRACERHLHDLAHGPERGLRFDAAAAEHVLRFFGFLRHSKGEWAGKPFVLELWQQFALWCQFGWRREDGLRRFRTAYKSVARKNGKSTQHSGVALYMLIADGEPGAEVYAAATKKDQARIVFEEAKRMATASPEIRRRVTILKDNMHVPSTASKFEPLSKQADTLDGLNVSCASIDELHAHPTRELWDVLETATGARRQPLMDSITTAGFDQMGICYELRSYGQTLLADFDKPDGVHDDTFFYLDYTLDDEDDWRDPQNWPKANPNLDVSVKRDDLQRKVEKATQIATAQNNLLTKHMNRWTRQDVLWLPMDRWDACRREISRAALARKKCYAGLDLSKTRDTSSLVLVFPIAGVLVALPFFWIPRNRAAERERADRVPYSLWASQGLIELTDGDVIDTRIIRERIRTLAREFNLAELRYDPWNATDTAIELKENDGIETVECRQGFASLSGPSKELENRLLAGTIAHDGHALLRWHASNVAVKDDGNGNIRPIKPNHQDPKKIDGIVALIMAISAAMVHPNDSAPSIFTL